jgi:hypothetical protein
LLALHLRRVDTTVAWVRVVVSRTVRGDDHGWRLHGHWRFPPGEDGNWPVAWQLLRHHSGLALSDLVFETPAEQAEFARDVHDGWDSNAPQRLTPWQSRNSSQP